MTPSPPTPNGNPVSNNPNAATAGGGGSVLVALVWFLGNVWPKWALSAEAGAGIVTFGTTVLLFVGKNGVRGIWRLIWRGGS